MAEDSQYPTQLAPNHLDAEGIKATAEGEAGNDCSSGSVLKRIFCPQHGVMEGTEQQLMSETQQILRMRLLAVSSIFLVCVILFSTRAFLMEGFFSFEQILVAIFFASSALYLKYVRLPSLIKLRTIELLVFGTMLVHLLIVNLNFILSLTVQAALNYLPSGIYRAAIGFFALIVVYGMFIPNR